MVLTYQKSMLIPACTVTKQCDKWKKIYYYILCIIYFKSITLKQQYVHIPDNALLFSPQHECRQEICINATQAKVKKNVTQNGVISNKEPSPKRRSTCQHWCGLGKESLTKDQKTILCKWSHRKQVTTTDSNTTNFFLPPMQELCIAVQSESKYSQVLKTNPRQKVFDCSTQYGKKK